MIKVKLVKDNNKIKRKDVLNNLSNQIPTNTHKKIGTSILIPNCNISV